ncbi:hypothetical protein ACFL4W_02690 [Planctomycetota bacterium]
MPTAMEIYTGMAEAILHGLPAPLLLSLVLLFICWKKKLLGMYREVFHLAIPIVIVIWMEDFRHPV